MYKEVTFPNGTTYKVAQITFSKKSLAVIGDLEEAFSGGLDNVTTAMLIKLSGVLETLLAKYNSPEATEEAIDSIPLHTDSAPFFLEVIRQLTGVDLNAMAEQAKAKAEA